MLVERMLAVLVAASACGPTDVHHAELRELCGEVGPVRVLEFPEDARPFANAWVTRVDDDVLLWQLWSSDPDSLDYPWPGHAWGPWLTGSCGESPQRIPGVLSAWVDPYLPGLISTSTGAVPGPPLLDFLVIDPKQLETQHALFTDVGIPFDWSRHGLFSVDDFDSEVATLFLRAYPEDPFSGPITPKALASVRGPFTLPDLGRTKAKVVVLDDAVWVLTASDELVRISLPDGLQSIEQAGVRTFELSEGERWLVWEDLTVLDHGMPFGEEIGRSHLRDRNDGTEHPLWIGHASPWSTEGLEDGLVPGPGGWLHVDDLSPVELPDGRRLHGPFGTERYWITDLNPTNPTTWASLSLGVFDVATGTEKLLWDQPAGVMDWRDDGIEIVPGLDHGTPGSPEETPVWFVPFDGSAPRELAHAVTIAYQHMADGRIVTPRAIAADYRAELTLVDPDTLEQSRIDDHVFVSDWPRELDPQIWGDDVVLYSVADGERSGMWIARLPEQGS